MTITTEEEKREQIARWCMKRLKELGIDMSNRGRFATTLDGTLYMMHDNHVRCLLKRDYTEKYGKVKDSSQIIDSVIAFLKKKAKEIKGSEKVYDVAYKLPT